MKQITLGADPEIFVEHKNGVLFPAFEFLPNKYKPIQTIEEKQNVYWDGFQAEFTIQPNTDISKCINSIRFGLKAVLNEAKKKDKDACLSKQTVVNVPLTTLANLPNEYVEFGCMPSYNAYQINGH